MTHYRLYIAAVFVSLLPSLSFSAPCPPEGKEGDGLANRLQNRDTPPSSYQEIEVPDFLKNYTPNLATGLRREQFTPAQKESIESREQTGVSLVGYLLMGKQAGREASNCNDKTRRNLQLWIGNIPEPTLARAKADRDDAIVVVATPEGQARHRNWQLSKIKTLSKQGAKIRISGWPYYNAEATDQFGKTRATLWEIHPVTKIEIWRNGGWQEL